MVAGREVEDIKLTFERGKVVKASAVKGEDLLKELLKIEGADRVGEVAVRTNYAINRFTKNMLFDEKIGRHNSHGSRKLLSGIWREE